MEALLLECLSMLRQVEHYELSTGYYSTYTCESCKHTHGEVGRGARHTDDCALVALMVKLEAVEDEHYRRQRCQTTTRT